MRIAVTGATGFVGGHLLAALDRAGHDIVAMARSEDAPPQIGERSTVDYIAASVTDEDAVSEAFRDCDAVAHLAGINYERGEQTYRDVHVSGTAAVLAAAESTNVDRVILTSYLRARPDCGSGYLESKWAAEELLRSAVVAGTILKPAAIFGTGDQTLTSLARTLKTVPILPRIGLRDRLLRPVAIEDVVDIAVAALEGDRLEATSLGVMGPEELTLGTMVQRIGEVLEKRNVCPPLPVTLQYLAAVVAERTLEQPLVTRAGVRMLAEGMTTPAPADVCDPVPEDLTPSRSPSRQYLREHIGEVRRLGRNDLRW